MIIELDVLPRPYFVLVCHAHVPPYIIALLRLPPLAKADLHALCPIDLLLVTARSKDETYVALADPVEVDQRYHVVAFLVREPSHPHLLQKPWHLLLSID